MLSLLLLLLLSLLLSLVLVFLFRFFLLFYKIQQNGSKWIKQAQHASKKLPNFNLNLPNTHLFIELLLRTLPILKSAHFTRAETFESHHVRNKDTLNYFKSQGCAQYEVQTMKQISLQEGLRFLFQKGRWGEDLKFKAGPKLLNLKNYAPGLEQEPHPLLQVFTSKIFYKTPTAFVYKSCWWATAMSYKEINGYKVPDTSNPSPKELKSIQSSLDEYYPDQKFQIKIAGIKGMFFSI